MKKTGFLVATTAIGLVLGATQAQAAGYAIKETSATQLGQSFAGAGALKNDISAMWNNPATMAFMKGHHFAVSASYIIPSAKFKEGGSSTRQGSGLGGEAGVQAAVPALYAMWSIQDNMKLGLALTSPFGLETHYDENWRGRYNAIRTRLRSLNINPNFAYKVNDYVSLAMGVSFQYVDIDLTKKINNASVGGVGDARFKARGNDWGAGFNVGLLVKPWEGARLGLAYRSKITHGLNGDVTISGLNIGAGAGAAAIAAGANLAEGQADITAHLTTPESIDFSYAQDLGEAWTLLASVVWTRWNRFSDLDIRHKANGTSVGSPERQGWKNVWFFALVANWKVAQNWMLRAGAAYDQEPINDLHRTAKLPGNDRTWLSAGVDWNFADWGKIALTYTHIFMKDGKINKLDGVTPVFAAGDRLQGKVQNKVDIIGLQANFKF